MDFMFRTRGMSKLARAEDVFADLTGFGWFPVQIKVPAGNCDNTHNVRPLKGFRVPSL